MVVVIEPRDDAGGANVAYSCWLLNDKEFDVRALLPRRVSLFWSFSQPPVWPDLPSERAFEGLRSIKARE